MNWISKQIKTLSIGLGLVMWKILEKCGRDKAMAKKLGLIVDIKCPIIEKDVECRLYHGSVSPTSCEFFDFVSNDCKHKQLLGECMLFHRSPLEEK